MFIKHKVVFNSINSNREIQIDSNFDFFEIYYNTDEKYFFEYYQYIDSYSKPELKFTCDKNLINSLKRTYKENIIKFKENKKSERKYPSLCCIERVYKNDLYNFKVLNIWENVW